MYDIMINSLNKPDCGCLYRQQEPIMHNNASLYEWSPLSFCLFGLDQLSIEPRFGENIWYFVLNSEDRMKLADKRRGWLGCSASMLGRTWRQMSFVAAIKILVQVRNRCVGIILVITAANQVSTVHFFGGSYFSVPFSRFLCDLIIYREKQVYSEWASVGLCGIPGLTLFKCGYPLAWRISSNINSLTYNHSHPGLDW